MVGGDGGDGSGGDGCVGGWRGCGGLSIWRPTNGPHLYRTNVFFTKDNFKVNVTMRTRWNPTKNQQTTIQTRSTTTMMQC